MIMRNPRIPGLMVLSPKTTVSYVSDYADSSLNLSQSISEETFMENAVLPKKSETVVCQTVSNTALDKNENNKESPDNDENRRTCCLHHENKILVEIKIQNHMLRGIMVDVLKEIRELKNHKTETTSSSIFVKYPDIKYPIENDEDLNKFELQNEENFIEANLPNRTEICQTLKHVSKYSHSLLRMSDSEDEHVIMALIDRPANHFSGSDSTNSSDSLFSDSDEAEPRRKRAKIENYVEKTVKEYNNDEFKSHFRMSQKTTYEFISLFEQSHFNPVYPSGRNTVTAEKTVLLSLWYLANRNSFREVSDRFGVSLSTAHNCLRRVLDCLYSVKNKYIIWPDHYQQLNMSQAFAKHNGIRGAIGAIDGSHIEIHKPAENQDSYVNRKGYHSLLLQGVVDNNKKFIDVFCGEPGSLHDARLLRRSALYAKILGNPDFIGEFFLLGDSAYPNLDWIVTPFPDTGFLSEEQKLFNIRLSSKRVVVENAFGLLKGRFRRLRGLENLDLNLCSKIILGACILHNICLDEDINAVEDIEEHDENQPPNVPFHRNVGMQNDVEEKSNRQQLVFKKMFNL